MNIPGEHEYLRILDSLDTVGNKKPVGYLPLRTITEELALDVVEYAASMQSGDRHVRIFSADECCIRSGALYVYDRHVLQGVLDLDVDLLMREGWPTTRELFVERLAQDWVEEDHPIYPVIQRAFDGVDNG